MMAMSSMAAICCAWSQRASRRSRSASMGARSSVSPSISMPRLNSQAPSRSGSCSFCTGRSRAASGPSTSLPSSSPVSGAISSFQRCTGTLSCANPGCTTTLQPSARSFGICSAQKSPKCASCASVHTGPSAAAAARWRHCSLLASTGIRPRSHTRSMASASAARLRCMRSTGPPVSNSSCMAGGRELSTEVGAGVCQAMVLGAALSPAWVVYVQSICASVTLSPRGPSGPCGRRPSRPSPRPRVIRVMRGRKWPVVAMPGVAAGCVGCAGGVAPGVSWRSRAITRAASASVKGGSCCSVAASAWLRRAVSHIATAFSCTAGSWFEREGALLPAVAMGCDFALGQGAGGRPGATQRVPLAPGR